MTSDGVRHVENHDRPEMLMIFNSSPDDLLGLPLAVC